MEVRTDSAKSLEDKLEVLKDEIANRKEELQKQINTNHEKFLEYARGIEGRLSILETKVEFLVKSTTYQKSVNKLLQEMYSKTPGEQRTALAQFTPAIMTKPAEFLDKYGNDPLIKRVLQDKEIQEELLNLINLRKELDLLELKLKTSQPPQ